MRTAILLVALSLVTIATRAEVPILTKAKQQDPSGKTETEIQCEEGVAEACCQAGTYYQFLAPALSPARALELQSRGCELGSKDCCLALEAQKKNLVQVYDVTIPEASPTKAKKGREDASPPSPPLTQAEKNCQFVQCTGKECGCEVRWAPAGLLTVGNKSL